MPTTVADLPPEACHRYEDDTIAAHIGSGRQRASMSWFVPIAHVDTFANAIFGAYESISYGGGAMIRRVPMIHPRYPALYAADLDIDYQGYDTSPGLDQYSTYSFVIAKVTFETPPYPTSGNTPYMSVTRSQTLQTYTVNGMPLKYVSDDKPVQMDCSRRLMVQQMQFTLHNLSTLDESTLATATLAPLNSTTFYTPFGNYAAGTVLLTSVSSPVQYYLGTAPTYQLTVGFEMRPQLRWDYRFREDTGEADQIVYVDDSDFYVSSDLNLIFGF